MIIGNVKLPPTDGVEIRPGVILIGAATPIPGTNKLRCLVDLHGCLAVVELNIKFTEPSKVIE